MEKAILPTPAATWSTRKPRSSSERLRPALCRSSSPQGSAQGGRSDRRAAVRRPFVRRPFHRASNFEFHSTFELRIEFSRMSLISSIQLANSSLQATQVGLQVVGQNIANANTPGYIRETVRSATRADAAPGQSAVRLGRRRCKALFSRSTNSCRNDCVTPPATAPARRLRSKPTRSWKGWSASLSDTDLSTSLDNFFSSISDILNQPESDSVRNLAVLQGQTLTSDINRFGHALGAVALRFERSRRPKCRRHQPAAARKLQSSILQIANAEGGGTSPSDAVGLRDQRNAP